MIIKGTNQIVPFEKHIPKRKGTVEIIFGKPVKYKKTDKDEEVLKDIRKKLEEL